MTEAQRGPEALSPQNEALIAGMKKHLAISPGLADLLREKWARTNLLLDAAREEARQELGAGSAPGEAILTELRALAEAARHQAETATTDFERARQQGRATGYEQAIDIVERCASAHR